MTREELRQSLVSKKNAMAYVLERPAFDDVDIRDFIHLLRSAERAIEQWQVASLPEGSGDG